MKELWRITAILLVVFAAGLTIYLWAAEAFTLPLGLMAIVAVLIALFLQGEAK